MNFEQNTHEIALAFATAKLNDYTRRSNNMSEGTRDDQYTDFIANYAYVHSMIMKDADRIK